MNDDIELELRKALQRVPAPEGFAERVMDRLPGDSGWEWWRMAVAAILVCALVLGGLQYRAKRREQEQAALRTQKEVVFAFALAAEKLQKVNYRLQHAGPELNVQKRRGKTYDE